ncbi:MAG: GNAT family N-acetyltransferase [Bacteroidota bacterium]
MIRLINPLDSKADFEKLTDSLWRFVNDPDSFKFLSYSLINFDKKEIEEMTLRHKENGIDYLVNDKDGVFSGLLAIKRIKSKGFELFLLVVDKSNQKSGIGQSLMTECIRIASKEKFKCVDSLVFADNKDMLRLLIKNDFIPIDIQYNARADGADIIKLRKYLITRADKIENIATTT